MRTKGETLLWVVDSNRYDMPIEITIYWKKYGFMVSELKNVENMPFFLNTAWVAIERKSLGGRLK